MSAIQGDGVTGLLQGNTNVYSRSQTRSRKRDKAWCLLCLKSGRKSRLQLFQIGGNEAMYLCSNETCPYPVSMSDDLHGAVIPRELTELKVTSPQKSNLERATTMNNFPTSMPIVVPVEVQKIPTMPREEGHFKRNSLGNLPEDPILQFKLWMREKKRPFRSNSLTQETQEEAMSSHRNGEVINKGDTLIGKRVRVRTNRNEIDSETDLASKNRITSNRLHGKAPRHFSTPSIRKIDKTLMEASGVDVDKKFEPFKITPKDSLPKPIPEESEFPSEHTLSNNEEDPLAINSQTNQTNIQDNLITNSNIENDMPNQLSGEDGIQPDPDVVQMDSLQMPILSPEQWQPHTIMSMQNGHVNDTVFPPSLIQQPQYMHDNYNMMSQYNTLIPPPSNYHNMSSSVPPALQSPLSPIPHPSNNYTNEQFYYPDNMYTDYGDQWEDLELTKMLDSINLPPGDQYDPTLGIIPPETSSTANMYGIMDPDIMTTSTNMNGPYDCPHPALQIPINSPLMPPVLPNSLPLNANTQNIASTPIQSPHNVTCQDGGLAEKVLKDIYNIDTNNPGDEIASFNNNQDSPMSSYQSPLSQGEYQSLSLVGSAT